MQIAKFVVLGPCFRIFCHRRVNHLKLRTDVLQEGKHKDVFAALSAESIACLGSILEQHRIDNCSGGHIL